MHPVYLEIEKQLEIYRAALPMPQKNWPSEVNELLQYINEHLFSESLTVAEAKTACGIHRTGYSTRFRRYIGLGVREYISHHRLKASCLLLEINNVSMTDIAFAIGYNRENSFSMAFQRAYGKKPSEWGF